MDPKYKHGLIGGVIGAFVAVGAVAGSAVVTWNYAKDRLVQYAVDSTVKGVKANLFTPILNSIPESALVQSAERIGEGTEKAGTNYNLSLGFQGHAKAVSTVAEGLANNYKTGKGLKGFVGRLSDKASKGAEGIARYTGTMYDRDPKGFSLGDAIKVSGKQGPIIDVSVELTEDRYLTAKDNLTGKEFDPSRYEGTLAGKILKIASDATAKKK